LSYETILGVGMCPHWVISGPWRFSWSNPALQATAPCDRSESDIRNCKLMSNQNWKSGVCLQHGKTISSIQPGGQNNFTKHFCKHCKLCRHFAALRTYPISLIAHTLHIVFSSQYFCQMLEFYFHIWYNSLDEGRPIARPRPSQDSTTQKDASIHICIEWNPNPRPQCSSCHDPRHGLHGHCGLSAFSLWASSSSPSFIIRPVFA
jgi:hypothetical protein